MDLVTDEVLIMETRRSDIGRKSLPSSCSWVAEV